MSTLPCPANTPLAGPTLEEALSRFLSDVDCATATRTAHTDFARYLCSYFGANRPVSDFAGEAGGALIVHYIEDETGGKDRGLRQRFSGPGNLSRALSYASIRQRLCTLRHALEAAVARGELSGMPKPWPVPRPGSHGHLNRQSYIVGTDLQQMRAGWDRRPKRVAPTPLAAAPAQPAPAGATTLSMLFDATMAHGRRAKATVQFRRDNLRHLIRFFGDRDVRDFGGTAGYKLLRHFVDAEGPTGRGVKYVTIRKILSCLRMMLMQATRQGDLPTLPPWPALPSDRQPRERYLTREEYGLLRVRLPAKWRIWFDIGVFTGQHTSDLDTMTWAMVDLGSGPGAGPGAGPAFWLRRNTKNHKRPAWLPMPDGLRQRLTDEWQAREATPTPSECIAGVWHNARRYFKRAAWVVGVRPFSPIDLRRTCATWLIEGGARKESIREWLGHAVTSEMVELHYAKITPLMVEDLVIAMNRGHGGAPAAPVQADRRALPPKAGDR